MDLNGISEKLDLLLFKIDNIDARLRKVESQSDDMVQYVPFVGWIEKKAKSLSFQLGWVAPTIKMIESTEEITNEACDEIVRHI